MDEGDNKSQLLPLDFNSGNYNMFFLKLLQAEL